MKAANYNSNKNESSTNIGSTYDLQVVAGKGDKEMAIHHNTWYHNQHSKQHETDAESNQIKSNQT